MLENTLGYVRVASYGLRSEMREAKMGRSRGRLRPGGGGLCSFLRQILDRAATKVVTRLGWPDLPPPTVPPSAPPEFGDTDRDTAKGK